MTPSAPTESGLTLTRDYRAGAVAEVVGLHMAYYAPNWGLGQPFETKVAGELGSFLARHDPARDLFLCAYDETDRMQASISIDGLDATAPGGKGAHLRWFIVSDSQRGTGLGRKMLEAAIDFCRAQGYPKVFLTTFAGLDAARHLYESLGFVLQREIAEDQWQGGVTEQHFSLDLGRRPQAGAA